MTLTVGSLCTGVKGLDLAVERVLYAETVWCAEYDAHASQVLEQRMPGVPNLHDLTVIDWSAVKPVDVLTAGYPCQPFSHAGRRQGVNDARHLWPYVADAIRVLRPRLVVLENVRGHLSMGFGRVLGDLAELGFDAEWMLLRAADVGLCHGRARVFIVARNTDEPPGSLLTADADADADADAGGRDGRTRPSGPAGRDEPADTARPATHTDDRLLPHDGGSMEGTPARGERPDPREGGRPPHNAGRTASADSPSTDGREPELDSVGSAAGPATESGEHHRAGVCWGGYGDAIERHERVVGRRHPDPLVGRTVNARFVEWMMALPEGWVTDIVPNRHALRLLGNAVVPLQAEAAVSRLLAGVSQ